VSFYYSFPGEHYACGPVEGTSEREFRAWLRGYYSLTRLPRGMKVWAADGRGFTRAYAEFARRSAQ